MMKPVRFIENETGIEVLVSTPFAWGNHTKTSLVEYPSGAVFAIADSEVSTHFTMVRPQEVFVSAFGGSQFERPTKQQRALEEASAQLTIV